VGITVVYNVDSDVIGQTYLLITVAGAQSITITNGTYYTAGTQLTTQASGAWKLVADASPGRLILDFVPVFM
jgi:hypothetical protein